MRKWSPPAWAIVSAMMLLLAGCSGPAEEPDASLDGPPDSTGEQRLEAVDAAGYAPIRLVEDVVTNVTAEFVGSFAMYETCPVWCGVPDAGIASGQRAHDMSGLVPVGIPTKVRAVLSHNAEDGPTPVTMGGHSLVIRTPDGTYGSSFSLTGSSATDEVVAEIVLRDPGPVELVVEYFGPEPDQATFDYRVDVDLRIDPMSVRPGVPVALDLHAGSDGLALRSSGEEEATFSVFTPSGSRLGPFTVGPVAGALPLPEGSPSGTYVLIVHDADAGVRLLAPDETEAPGVRVMDLRMETGEAVPLDDEGSASWSFDVEGIPVQVGFILTSGQASWIQGAAGFASTEEGRAVLDGPESTIFDRTVETAFNCVLCPEPLVFEFGSRSGHEGIVSGTYHADFRAHTGPGGSVQGYWIAAS